MSLVSSKKVETNRAELTVEVKGEQFAQAVEAAYRKNMKSITVPGFRKGKAPRAMVEKLYGKGMFLDEAMNALYPAAYSEAVDEAGITPVDSAEVEVLSADEEGFTFKATVTTRPVATLGKYKGLSVDKTVPPVTEEQIEEQIAQMREKYARVITVEGRAAQEGDIAEIDFEGFSDGVAFEGGKGEKYPLTLGSGSFIPGFEEQIVGKNIGDEFDVNVTFPEGYGESSLAGKPALFKVKLNDLKERELPEVDDEFAKDISEFDTIAAYKEDIKKRLTEAAQSKAEAEVENKLLEQVVADMTVEIPDCMIENRINELVQDFGMRMSQQGLSIQDFMRYTGETEEKFRETFRTQAENQVKTRLAMEAIAAAENIVPDEKDIADEYQKLAEHYHMDIEKIRGAIREKELVADIACRKALETVTESAAVTVVEAATAEPKAEEKVAQKPKAAKKTTKKAADDGAEAPKPKRTRKAKADTEAE
ncbi:trigger factor [Oscillospiraceae bacterium LTW-04]|nr:trigger factor [Oscillospiraceae bacterium MB24-C1]